MFQIPPEARLGFHASDRGSDQSVPGRGRGTKADPRAFLPRRRIRVRCMCDRSVAGICAHPRRCIVDALGLRIGCSSSLFASLAHPLVAYALELLLELEESREQRAVAVHAVDRLGAPCHHAVQRERHGAVIDHTGSAHTRGVAVTFAWKRHRLPAIRSRRSCRSRKYANGTQICERTFGVALRGNSIWRSSRCSIPSSSPRSQSPLWPRRGESL